jgi:hypothetical protein
VVPVSTSQTKNANIETNGDNFRVCLIRHTITLAKSKADAEEERRERQAEAEQHCKNQHRAGTSNPDILRADVVVDMDDQTIQDVEITTTIKRYLKYDNLFLYT